MMEAERIVEIPRREAEEELRRNERRFRALVENSSEAVALLDGNGTLVYLSRSILGYPIRDLIGRGAFEMVHPEDRPAVRQAFDRSLAQAGTGVAFDGRCRHKDGSWRHVEGLGVNRLDDPAVGAVVVNYRDVSEHRRSEEALRRAEEKYRSIFENSAAGIFRTTPAGEILAVNPAMAHMLGYASPGELIASKGNIKELYLEPERRAELLQILEQHHSVEGYELQFVRNGGAAIWVSASARAIRTPEGSVLYYEGSCQDVTQRKLAEQSLRNSERLYRLLFADSPQPMWVFDTESLCFLEVNNAAVSHYGYSREEFLAMTLQDIRPPEDVSALLANIEEARLGGPQQGVWRHLRKDGSVIDVEVSADDIDFGGRRSRLVISRDVTEQRRTEHRLSMQYAITSALAESATLQEAGPKILKIIGKGLNWKLGAILEVDARANVLRFADIWSAPSLEIPQLNDFTATTTFRPNAGLAGRVWSTGEPMWVPDVSLLTDAPANSILLSNRHALRAGFAFPIRARQGILGVIELFSQQTQPPDGELLKLFNAVGSQIGQFAERKQLADQFLQAQKMEAIGRLAGGIAHDFNNLMTAVIGYSDLLLHRLEEGDPTLRDVAEIRKAGERASSLTRQLLAFSRRQAMEVRILNLNDAVSAMDKILQRLIGEDIDLISVVDPNLGQVRADPGQIEQVIMNLVVNARDAMPDGGKLTIETRNVQFGEGCPAKDDDLRPSAYVILAISDTGYGMDAETQRYIFEPFFTTKEGGTGLGLSTVYGIVKQSGGAIQVYSEPGVGTTFKIYLPRVGEDAAPFPEEKVEYHRVGGSGTILLVEDDDAIRTFIRRVLEAKGYTLLEAGSAEQGLEVAKEHPGPVDLLLTDMVLPGKGGAELAKELLLSRSDLKVLYMSGYTEDALSHNGSPAASAFLQKPFAPDSLLQKVAAMLA